VTGSPSAAGRNGLRSSSTPGAGGSIAFQSFALRVTPGTFQASIDADQSITTSSGFR
jgi:hypothetical protein